jgi:broad specificity phosphatase PhoE
MGRTDRNELSKIMRIYLIRHAMPDYENDTLTAAGHREATILAAYLKTLGVGEIYASPYGRTCETAQIAGDVLGLPVQVEEWTRELPELFIRKLNRILLDASGTILGSEQFLSNVSHWDTVPPLGSPVVAGTLARIRRGSDNFLARQGFTRQEGIYRVQCENRKNLAVFTHMGVVQAWLAHLLQVPLPFLWSGFHVHPASVTTVLFDEREAGKAVPRCLGVGDVAYLRGAGVTPSEIGFIANHD